MSSKQGWRCWHTSTLQQDILRACLHEDTGAATFSCGPNAHGLKKEPPKREAAAVAPKMKGVSAPADVGARGQHSCSEPDAQPYICSMGAVLDCEQSLSSSFSLRPSRAGRTAGRWLLQAAIVRSTAPCSHSHSSP